MSTISVSLAAPRRAPRPRRRSPLLAILWCAGACSLAVAAVVGRASAAQLTVEQIVARHIVARGGLAAWHAVQTMSWTGKLDAGNADSIARSEKFAAAAMTSKTKAQAIAEQTAADKAAADKQVELPFVIDMKRPSLSRVELKFAGKTAVQVFNGTNGWKLRPYLNRDDWEPFTPAELKASDGKWQIDGPLLDYAAQGIKVALEGIEPIDGLDAYRLKLTARDGKVRHIWIDAKSFLDVKVEGTPRRMDGKMHTVWIYQRDFRAVQGLKIPYVLETAVDGYRDTHKMFIATVTLNPALSDALFRKPGA